MAETEETLLSFPCDFPIKVMGDDDPALRQLVNAVVEKYAPGTPVSAFTEQLSRSGRFVSITVRIKATSKQQLDAMYTEFTDSHLTKYVL